jgi:hypothetical protein
MIFLSVSPVLRAVAGLASLRSAYAARLPSGPAPVGYPRRVPWPGFRRALAYALGLGALLLAPEARAELRVKWDCFLPNSGIDCALLESSLTSKIPFVKIVPTLAEADVVATLTAVPAEGGMRFRLDFVGKPLDGYVTQVHSNDKIPSSIDSTTATVRILTKVERGLDDFMDQKVIAEVKDGTLDIQLTDPSHLPFTGRPEQSSLKWYVAPGVGAYFSDVVGVGINAQGNASLSFNYSERAWRIQQQINGNYFEQSQPVAGTNETASIKWTLGALAAGEKNPQANYTFRANASVGIEFDLIPRQTVNQKNFGFRCAVGPEFQKYDATNVEGINQQLVARQFCDVFLSWHFDAIDVGGSLGETTILQDITYRGFSASASITWRMTDNLILAPWVYVQQINQAINEAQPTTVVYSDPRQEVQASMLAAVQQGYTAPFGIQAGLSLKFVFGNGSLSIEDQRWKGTSNLR